MGVPIVRVPKPMDHQLPVLLSPARFKVLACGRRWGKTTASVLMVLRGHGQKPGAFRGAIDGGHIWYVSPTYKLAENSEIWPQLKWATRFCQRDKSEMNRRIELPTGGIIEVRSADDPDSLRGPGLDGVVYDEAGSGTEAAWNESLRPALTDKQGWAALLSTPKGRNWFYKIYEYGRQSSDWECWRRPTIDNPIVTEHELDDAKRVMGTVQFAQEHMAEFVEIEGALFQSHCFDDHIWDADWPDSFEMSAIAVDPSLGASDKSDFCAIVFVGIARGKLWVDCVIDRKAPEVIIESTVKMFQRYNPMQVGFEGNAFQAVLGTVADQYCRINRIPPLPYSLIENREAKVMRIARLDSYLSNHQMRFHPFNPHCETLVDQLQMFPNREWHDDGPDALEMAIRLLNHMAAECVDDELEQVVR